MPLRHVIPLFGEVVADDFLVRPERQGLTGFCEVCCEKFTKIRYHFLKYHATPKVRYLPKSVKNLTSEKIPKERVFFNEGVCSLCKDDEGNPKRLAYLRNHYRDCHLKEKWSCPICNAKVSIGQQPKHLQTHSGPVQCLECKSKPISYAAAKIHFGKYHKGLEFNVSELTDEETKVLLQKRAPDNSTNISKQDTANVVTVLDMKKKLDSYTNKIFLNDKNLTTQIDNLFDKFLTFFHIPNDDDVKVVKNTSFISLWKVSWMTPLLVFELVPKTTGITQLRARTFYPDPQLGKPNQPKSDSFRHSGYAFGHLASGADFRDLAKFIPTHFFSNIAAMRNYFNFLVRPKLEKFIREEANSKDEPVYAVHFPIMRKRVPTKLNGVHVADGFGCVMISEDSDDSTITAWEMENNDTWQDYKNCLVDPLQLMATSSIPFSKSGADFKKVNGISSTAVVPRPTVSSSSVVPFPTLSNSISKTCPTEEDENDDSSSDSPSTSMSIPSHPISTVAKGEEGIHRNVLTSFLTPLFGKMDMENEDNKSQNEDLECSRKRTLRLSSSPSPIIRKKAKVGDSHNMSLSGKTVVSLGNDTEHEQKIELDEDALDFKVPNQKAAREQFLKVFRKDLPSRSLRDTSD